MAQQHKTCTKCGETKPLDGFHKKRATKDGVASHCKPCRVESSRRYNEANRDKIADYRLRSREKIAESQRRYYQANRDELLEYRRRHYEENREIINSKVAKYHLEDRELVKQLATVPLRTPFLPGEDALILADNGMTIYQKAIELGRTYDSVNGRRKRLLRKLNA